MTAFCHPERSPDAWLAGIRRDLTSDAAAAFASVLPSRVPCTHASAASIVGLGDGSTQVVAVRTDAGRCTVTLQRRDDRASWLVSRIALPAQH